MRRRPLIARLCPATVVASNQNSTPTGHPCVSTLEERNLAEGNAVRFQILGPVRATRGGDLLSLGGPKQRLVLALLIVDAPRTVSGSRLMDGLWGDDPPATAKKTLQGYIHHLRAVLPDVIVTDGTGYRLDIEPVIIDAVQFSEMVATARSLTESDPAAASRTLVDALALWNGQPFSDLDGVLALDPEIVRLQELRITAIEDRIALDLGAGKARDLIGELESLTRDHPLREGFRALHMRALYETGRQADALRAYERTRQYLADELGLEPSRELRELESRILNQDPILKVRPHASASSTPFALRGYEIRETFTGPTGGTTYRAYQASVGREVALKLVAPDVADASDFVASFEEECVRIGALEHPTIVALRDAWREPGGAYQVHRWMEGGDLRSRLNGAQMSPAAAMQVLEDVSQALSYAHREGAVHGRLTPSNIVFDVHGAAFVTDFSISGTVTLGGSPDDDHYRAPEIDAGSDPISPATDIFSLGALAEDLLGGVMAGYSDAPQMSAPDDADDAFTAHVRKAMHPEVAERHSKVEDLMRGLRQALGVDVGPPATEEGARFRSHIRNPYKGLRAVQEADAADFFGRADLIERLRTTVLASSFVAVVGPSGIGKSSMVKAGLIPAIRAQRSEGDAGILVTEMFPGSHPYEELEAALLRVAVERPVDMIGDLMADERGLLRVSKQILPDDGSELLLVIDQFEELFSLVNSESLRASFLATLVAAATDERSRIRVVVTLRADFYDKPLEYHDFGSLLEYGTIPLMMPSRDELARAVAGPATAVHLELESGLVGAIISDVSDQPGGLPLMQYALTELVERRTTNLLTSADYRATGGVVGSLGARAEELWQSLGGSGREAIRQTFLRLVTIDDGTDDVRRRVRRSELATLDVSQTGLNAALTLFGAHRLISFDRDPITRGPTIEVAHEALFQGWDRLQAWVESHREGLILRRQLTTALSEWEVAGQDDSYLLRGGRLEQFESWAATTGISLTTPEVDFIGFSQTLRDTENQQERASRKRLKRMLIVASILAVVAIGAGAVAIVQGQRAQDEATAASVSGEAAETRRLALQAPQLVETNRQVALLLAVEAVQRGQGAVALGSLQDVLVHLPRGFQSYVAAGEGSREIAFTPMGTLMALRPSSLYVIDADTGETRSSVDVVNASNLVVSPGGDVVAYADDDGVTLIDIATGLTLHEFVGPGEPLVTAVAFDATGSRIAIGQVDGALIVFSTETGLPTVVIDEAHPERSVEGLEVPPHQPGQARIGTRVIAFSDDGSRIATGGLVFTRVWEALTGERLDSLLFTRRQQVGPRVGAAVEAVRFIGTDGDQLRVASTFNVVDYTVGEGRINPVTEREFSERINAVSSPEDADQVLLTEQHAILAESGGRVAVIDYDTDTASVFDSQLSSVSDVSASPDGEVIAVAGREAVALWSPHGDGLITRSLPRDGSGELTFNEDGSMVVLNSADRQPPVVFDLSANTALRVELADTPETHFAWLGPADGLLSWDFETTQLRFRGFSDFTSEGVVSLGPTPTEAVAMSLDGDLVAVSGGPPSGLPIVQVFDLTTGDAVTEPLTDLLPDGVESPPTILGLSFDSETTRLVGSTVEGAAVVWDTTTWGVVATLSQGGGQIVIAEYSPNGEWLVTVASDGTVLLRDPGTFQPVGGPLVGQVGGVAGFSHGPSFSANGRYMVTTSDGSGRLWDLEERSLVGSAFPSDPVTSPGTSGDGRWLGTFEGDRVVVWDLDTSQWPEAACRAAGRNLTIEEWGQFGPPGEAYNATCDMWPAATQ